MAWFVVMLGFAGLAIGSRLVAGRWDRERIAADIEAGGGRVEVIEWAPLGHGWFGERGDRIYEVTWSDRRGRMQRATCKTSALSGVYWHTGTPPARVDAALPAEADAAAGAQAAQAAEAAQAASELKRLRAENARLKRQLKRGAP